MSDVSQLAREDGQRSRETAGPNQEGHDHGSEATGLTLTRQLPANAMLTLDIGDASPADVWREFARSEGFRTALLQSLRTELAGQPGQKLYEVFDQAGITALDGDYIDLCARVARGDTGQALSTLFEATTSFGQPQHRRINLTAGVGAPLSAVSEGPLAVIGLSAGPASTIIVRVHSEFERRKAEQRRTICRLLTDLAQVFDVRVVTNTITERFLRRRHHEQLPGVSEACNDAGSADRIAALVDQAWIDLDPTGRPISMLRSIGDHPSESRSYDALEADSSVSRGRIRQCIGDLRDHDLVETFDGLDGVTVSLLPPGRELIDRLDEQIGRQCRLEECVSDSGQFADHGRVTPPAYDGPPAAGREDGRDSVAGAGRYEWVHGPVDVRYLNRREHVSAIAGTKAGGIGLVDHPIDPQEDGRQPGWSYDADAERLVVTAEYHNPCQYGVATGRALASEKTLGHVLTPDRLDGEDRQDDLGGLDVEYLDILRNARNLGWLPDRAADGEGYIEELRGAREDLLELTRKMRHADREGDDDRYYNLRSMVTSVAHGLAGTVVHLLDLVGVEVVHEVRLPRFRQNRFSDAAFRSDLATHLGLRVAIQSRYAQFVTYRQLYETDPQKRENALSASVDAADPFGSLVGSVAIVGPGVSDLEADLRQAIRNPAAIHEDAPEFALRVPIANRTDARPAYAQAVSSVCQAKDLCPTRTAVSLIRAFTGSPYDGATALAALASETNAPGREIHADEVRYALSSLSPSQLLPDAPPSVSKVVHTLLRATEPLSRTELADRADVSPKSVYRHREVLDALDLVRETASGLRFLLPFREERSNPEAETPLPWYAVGSPDRPSHLALGDIVFEIVESVIADPARLADPGDPIGGPFFMSRGCVDLDQLLGAEALPWAGSWVSVVEALLDPGGSENSRRRQSPTGWDVPKGVVVMGELPSQAALHTDALGRGAVP